LTTSAILPVLFAFSDDAMSIVILRCGDFLVFFRKLRWKQWIQIRKNRFLAI